MNFKKNNLDKALSPYLQQHKDNPIHWQEWNSETLEHAKKEKKLIFLSIGYASCHWCHVQSSEAFSNKEVANFLNEHFISIKVDREQRPDIDQYFLNYCMQTQGQGGWPLNVFLTPEQTPFFATTYIPLYPKYGLPGFLELSHMIKAGYEKEKEKIKEMSFQKEKMIEQDTVDITKIYQAFDKEHGGFGNPKFPPHATLLFLIHYAEKTKNKDVLEMIEKTLDTIGLRGLHDHLQGGFFRYCTDQEWTIPHFEKMLYDQALLLWSYSLAYKLFKKEAYKTTTEKIIQCLEESFEENSLYYSAHDADTEHEEGTTYLWTEEEIQESIGDGEWERFASIYETRTNFEGKIHLLKKKFLFLPETEKKLLKKRKERTQPFVDKKILTSWNALTGIAYLIAGRYTENTNATEKGKKLFQTLKEKHYLKQKLMHSSLGEHVQEEQFLEDYASFLLLTTYIYEETEEEKDFLEELYKKIHSFKKENSWIESNNTDFKEIAADSFDHPTPSSISLAEYALLRTEILLEKEYKEKKYKETLFSDFYNLVSWTSQGNVHIIHGKGMNWKDLPINCIQVKGQIFQDCYQGKCMAFEEKQDLLHYLKKYIQSYLIVVS